MGINAQELEIIILCNFYKFKISIVLCGTIEVLLKNLLIDVLMFSWLCYSFGFIKVTLRSIICGYLLFLYYVMYFRKIFLISW